MCYLPILDSLRSYYLAVQVDFYVSIDFLIVLYMHAQFSVSAM
jgi:hypothetical protein